MPDETFATSQDRTPFHSPLGRRAKQAGNTLLLIMLLLAVLSLLAVAASYTSRAELRNAQQEKSWKAALYLAEGGINHAWSILSGNPDMNNALKDNGTGGQLADIGAITTVDGATYRYHASTGATGTGYYVRAQDNNDGLSGPNSPLTDRDTTIFVVSRGQVGTTRRTLQAMVQGTSLFGPWAIYASHDFQIKGKKNSKTKRFNGFFTDSFDSERGDYSGTTWQSNGNIGANGDITLKEITDIAGNVSAVGKVTMDNTANVTGTITKKATPRVLPAVPTCGPPWSPGAGITMSAGSYDANKGDMNPPDNATVTLANGTYCFHDFNMGKATLTVNGPVHIFATGNVDFSNATVNNTTKIAANLIVFDAAGDKNITLSQANSATYMAVYAPDVNIVFNDVHDFQGAIVGKDITWAKGGGIHFDEALAGVPGTGPVNLSDVHELRE